MSVGGPGQLIKSLDDLIAEEKKSHKKGSFMNKPIKKDKRFLREEMEELDKNKKHDFYLVIDRLIIK
jgi:hypothetical protein